MLPACLLASVLVGAPFAGTTTSALTAEQSSTGHAGRVLHALASAGPADQPLHLRIPGGPERILILAYVLLLLLALGVVTFAARWARRQRLASRWAYPIAPAASRPAAAEPAPTGDAPATRR
jgi:hypothetical protein